MLCTMRAIIILCVVLICGIKSARILCVFPMPSISHQKVFRPLTHELARRGHDVVVITPDPYFPKGNSPPNLTEIDIHDVSYKEWQKMFESHTGDKDDILRVLKLLFETMTSTYEKQIQTAEVQRLIKEEKENFDLLILEACFRPALGLAHVFNVPIIQFSSFGAISAQYNLFGAPLHPILYPSAGRVRIYNLTLWEKAKELFKYGFLEWLISSFSDNDFDMMKRNYGEDIPSIRTLLDRIQMLFLNEHPFWADNHPVPPNIVYVGGIHQIPPKELPKEFQQYLDSVRNGVIYVSFGTNVIPSLLPRDKIKVMAKVLSEMPHDVLWKWDSDDLPINSSNIKFSKWVPQADLLKHEKVKLFITQGGLQSTDEAINAGVPLIGMPMLGDQWYNVEKYVKHKFGLQLDLISLTEDDLRNALETIITDPSYKQNILKIRSIMQSHPIKPLDLAVWWVEHILRYGGNHLRTPSYGGINFFKYYEIPLVLMIFSFILIILTVLSLSITFTIRRIKNIFYQDKLKKKQEEKRKIK